MARRPFQGSVPDDPGRRAHLRSIAAQVRTEVSQLLESAHHDPGRACSHALTTALALLRLHDEAPSKRSEKQSKTVALGVLRMFLVYQRLGGEIIFKNPPETTDGTKKDGRQSKR